MKKIVRWMEICGWRVYREETSSCINYTISNHTPAGGECSIDLCMLEDNPDVFIRKLKEWIEAYDISREAFLWLDNDGHGCYGAPYEMIDVYKDKEAFLNMAKDLLDGLEKLMIFLTGEEKERDEEDNKE